MDLLLKENEKLLLLNSSLEVEKNDLSSNEIPKWDGENILKSIAIWLQMKYRLANELLRNLNPQEKMFLALEIVGMQWWKLGSQGGCMHAEGC
ncbi:hypothetical protein QYF36_024081 [Acer negundo]|nr:hypothetical protein QYF36_024081 [Acer negundo]